MHVVQFIQPVGQCSWSRERDRVTEENCKRIKASNPRPSRTARQQREGAHQGDREIQATH